LFLDAQESESAVSEGVVPNGTRSLLNVRKRLRYGEFVWDETDAGTGLVVVRVNLQSQLVSVFRGGHEIGTAVILYGAQGHDTPLGRLPIMAKIEDHHSATYDAPMPYTLWLTPDGVAIHGSKVRWGAATHGCIGVPMEFAKHLFDEASVGDVVEVVHGGPNKLQVPLEQTPSTIY
jgi:lipoprotein-anchoring transpeptidase ErfK/SrfK